MVNERTCSQLIKTKKYLALLGLFYTFYGACDPLLTGPIPVAADRRMCVCMVRSRLQASREGGREGGSTQKHMREGGVRAIAERTER